ncbi:MAG: GlcG/HbpS family heme-binding protein [Ornithinibacter sp.]
MATATPASASEGTRPPMAPTLGSAQAQRVLAAAERAARGLGVAAFIVVVDDCADLKAASRQDGNSRASLTLAPLKAETSVAFRISTATLASRTTDPVRAQSLLAAGFTLLGGGVPLIVDSQVVGAIGVGGGSPDQDVQIAEAGAAALRS